MHPVELKPVFLFADSQFLFYWNESGLFLDKIKYFLPKEINGDEIKAAYIGASNGDDPQFYEIFEIAMQQIEIRNCQMIKSNPDKDDNKFLKRADIILLAGGNTEKGWDVIKRNGWDDIITCKYFTGAILIGISAGAIQLGAKGFQESNDEKIKGFNTLQLVPFIIDVHADDNWLNLIKRVESEKDQFKGYGIPYGAGIIYYPDMSLETVRFPCIEIIKNGENTLKSEVLLSSSLY